MSPPANAQLDFSPPHVGITYDSDVLQNGTSLALLDSTGAPVPVQPDETVGILEGTAQAQAPAADLTATLTVLPATDGSSLLRADLNNTAGVERIRIQLSRPDLGVDLHETRPSGDGGWVLNGNEVAIPGTWHAQIIVRRTNVVEDAKADFDFNVDNTTGAPAVLCNHLALQHLHLATLRPYNRAPSTNEESVRPRDHGHLNCSN